MRSSTLVPALLLCSLSWIPPSTSGSQTVEVRPGEGVTLTCSNISRTISHTFWSKLDNVNRNKISCISSMHGIHGDAVFCDGFKNDKFNMSGNGSFVSLKIKQVDFSDSGLYLCGFYVGTHTVIDVIHVKVGGDKEPHPDADGKCKEWCSNSIIRQACLIMAALTVVLLMIIVGLLVKIMTLQTEERGQQDPGSDDLNYAAVSFHPKPARNCEPVSESPLQMRIVYTVTR